MKHEEKDGTKLTGVNIGGFSGLSALLPEPINSTTDQVEAAVSYADEKANLSVGYYGSIYRNETNLWTVENAAANNVVLNNVPVCQSYPDNQMHQLNLVGGYKFSSTTRLLVSASYARLTQNEQFSSIRQQAQPGSSERRRMPRPSTSSCCQADITSDEGPDGQCSVQIRTTATTRRRIATFLLTEPRRK